MRPYTLLLILFFTSPVFAGDVVCDYNNTTDIPIRACKAFVADNYTATSTERWLYNDDIYDEFLPTDYVGSVPVTCKIKYRNKVSGTWVDSFFNETISCYVAPTCEAGTLETHTMARGVLNGNINGCFDGCSADIASIYTVWETPDGTLYNEASFTLNGSTCSSGEDDASPLVGATIWQDNGDGSGDPDPVVGADPSINDPALGGLGEFQSIYPNGTCKDLNGNIVSSPDIACQALVNTLNDGRDVLGARHTSLNWVTFSNLFAQTAGPLTARCDTGSDTPVTYIGLDGLPTQLDTGHLNRAIYCSTNDCYLTGGNCSDTDNGNGNGNGGAGSSGVLTGGLSCDSPPVCEGDDVGCYQSQMLWKDLCPSADEMTENQILTMLGLDGIDKNSLFHGSFDVGNFNIDGFFDTDATCPTFPSFTVLGVVLSWNVLPMCEIARILGILIMVSGFIHSMRILIGAM